ncbi:zinc finger protein 91-like [Elysia marginata]|uniref:Zinc finger protein 91-like n=1 Tax=Elysia marginata TaxID=1093978 RepID=A0AAV4EH08_9GAST|nr:zinc finger protein 91-like [Elysia marginata]
MPLHKRASSNETNGKPDGEVLSAASSPICEIPELITDPDIESRAAVDQNEYPDFFQSLELKSITEETPSNARIKAVQRLSILEDDTQAELLLPITSILSNLDFSSDDDFLGLSDAEDGDENLLVYDDGESQTHPPEGHTGGKWKPGEGPKRRMPIAGKWKPGQKPGPACRKNILRKPAKVKDPKADVGKSFYCNVCHSFFMDRNAYSLHFGQSRHQEMAAAKKLESFQQSSFDKRSEIAKERTKGDNEINTSTKEMQCKATSPAKAKDNFYCKDCNLYFNNSVVNTTDTTPEQAVDQPAAPEVHECPICTKSFTRKYEMARHLLTQMHAARARHHPQAASVEMLERYNKYMVRLMPFQCGVCRFYFNNQIMTHLQCPEHYSAVENKFGICVVKESHTRITCKFCGVHMHSAVRMKQHCMRKHKDRMSNIELALTTKPIEKNFHKCPLCTKKFKSKSLLQLHFLKVHKNKYLFNCDVCKRGFLDQRRLDNHLRTRFHAKRVVASKLKENSATVDSSIITSHAKGTDQRRSERRKKGVKFFDDEHIEKNLATLEKNKNSKTKQANTKPPPSSRLKYKEEKNCKTTNKSNAKVLAKNKSAGEKTSPRTNTNRGSINELIQRDANQSDNESRNLTGCDPDMEVMGEKENLVVVTLETSSQVEEEDDEDMIIEEEAEVGEGEILPANEDELDKEEHARVNEASLTIFSCTYCEFAATDLLELRAHYSSSHPQEILTCQPCDQWFLSLKAYKIHCAGRGHQLKLREMTGETTIHKCRLCDKRFLQAFSCRLHLETVHRHPSCEEDLKRLHKGQDLVSQLYGEHIKQVETLSNETSVSCPECGKFVRKDTLVEHLRLHTGERPYTCRFCGRGFAGRLTLRRHLSGHLNVPLFMCDLCGKAFKQNNLLKKHLKQHEHEKRGEKHTCKVCKAWFYTPEELERHSRRHGDRKFHCTWPGCNWSFIQAGELKSHMYKHTGEKRFLCDQCGFGAPTKNRLRRHAKTHLKTKTFACDYCPYKASMKTHLRRHMRIHINSRPFKCPYCKYTCNTHENMRKHILRTQKHKGKKLYPCHLCKNYGSNSSMEFKAHLMTVHAEYLKENAVDSLAVFSGLYKREEDFQKPKEGSEIIQVTKGRFFKSYQNIGSESSTGKGKKSKPKSSRPVIKKEALRVKIVPPEEIHRDLDAAPNKGISEEESECKHFLQQQQQQQENQSTQNSLSHIQQQHHQISTQLGHYESQSQQQTVIRTGVSDPHYDVEELSQCSEVNPVILNSYTLQSQVLHTNSFSSSSNVVRYQQFDHKKHHEEQESVALPNKPLWTQNSKNTHNNHNLNHSTMNIHNHQHGHSFQHIPHSQTTSSCHSIYNNSHLKEPHQQSTGAVKQVASDDGRNVLSPEPWYSGMPQVHAPTSQELQESYSRVDLKGSNEELTSTSLSFSPEAEYLSHVSAESQSQQHEIEVPHSVLTGPSQIYTISVSDNVRFITQVAKEEEPAALSTDSKQLYFPG